MFVYILKSLSYNWHYIGLTDNIERRFEEHNEGWVRKTRFYKPFKLVHVEIVDDLISAREIKIL